MSDNKHVSRDELLEMLGGENETPQFDRIGEHVHQCSSCRNKLDALAAQSEIWNKAPTLLKSDLPSRSSLSSTGLETTERAARDNNQDEPQWSWPIDSILETPRHPEMMGRIGDYDIEREIGRGGMGIVLKAHEAELNRPLAIKVLAPHLASHGPARQRFAQEARSAAGVIHPNVVAVHRVENDSKTPYIVMQFIAGPSMQTLVEENGPLVEEEIVRMSLQIAAGLTAAHSQGLVHRDIKPANILVADGGNRVLITDFGLARAEDDASLTRTGWLTGTPNYMSPEQTRGLRIDHRSDLFSLGSLIYFLATGRLPFRSESPLGVLRRIQEDQPTEVRQVNRKVSKTLADIIDVLLEKDPANRFQSAADLHEVLKKQMFFLHQPDTSHPPIVKKQTFKTSLSPKYWWGGMVAGGIALLAIGYSMIPIFDRIEPENTSTPPAGSVAVTPDSKDQSIANETLKKWDALAKLDGHGNRGDEQAHFVSITQDEDQDGQKAFEKGLAQLEEEDFKGAVKSFGKSATNERLRDKSLYNIACAMALNGETEKAIDQLEIAIEAGCEDYRHYLSDSDLDSLRDNERFVDLLADLKEVDQSRELLSEALEMADEGRFDEAKKQITDVMEVDPNNEKAWLNLGYALHMQERYDDAMKWHQKAASGKDHLALGNYNVACVQAIRGETDAAFDSLELALESGLAKDLRINHIKTDSDLENLRDDKRFDKFLKRYMFAHFKSSTSKFWLTDGSTRISTSQFSMYMDDENWEKKIEGDWNADLKGDKVEMQILRSSEGSDWTWSYFDDLPASDFEPNVDRDSANFKLEKKYGSLVFNGAFDGVEGAGEFEFVGSDSFRTVLAAAGIENAPDALLFQFFFSWQEEEKLIENLKTLSSLGLGRETLTRMMIGGVDAKLVKAYQSADLEIEPNRDFIIWHVDPKLIRSYIAAGLSPDEHKKFVKRRIDARLLVEYNDAGFDLEKHDHFISSRISARALEQYSRADFDIFEHKDFLNSRVPASLLKAYQAAGLAPNDHREFIQWRLDPKMAKEYIDSFGIDEVDELQDFIKGHVPAKLLISYENAGFPPKEHTDFLRSRVPAKLLKSYSDAGFDLGDHKELINSRIDVQLLKRYEKAGLEPLDHVDSLRRRVAPKDLRSNDE